MGWKDEVRNSPIQTMAAILALVGALVSAAVYLTSRSEDSSASESSPTTTLEVELPPKPTPPPPFEDELPKLPPPPFLKE